MLWLRWIAFAVSAPGLALALGPWLLLRRERGGRADLGALHALGWLPLGAVIALVPWCRWDFATRGRGTPAP